MEFIQKYSKIILFVIFVAAMLLRVYGLNKVPVSMFSDELDVGYQALSIIETGKDYSGNPWPLHFESMAEYRTPIYIYATVPFVYLFGITPYAVRLPAAIFGSLTIIVFYFWTREFVKIAGLKSEKSVILALGGALFMAISPWHIQYSRAGFEVTTMLFFLLTGAYFFFKSHTAPKKIIFAAVFLALTPWIYSTAKLFVPAMLLVMFAIWRKDILQMPRKYLTLAIIIFILISIPLFALTVSNKAGFRYSYISVFTDPTTTTEVDSARLYNAQVRQFIGDSVISKVSTRLVNNKYAYWGSKVTNNYLETFSTNFLFLTGDPNLRHSTENVGQFYKVEALVLILGVILFFSEKRIDRKLKWFLLAWIFFGALPSAITREGGVHATRLFLILTCLLFLISWGLVFSSKYLSNRFYKVFFTVYIFTLLISFGIYLHNYWVHNPFYSERAWHAGYKELVESVKGKSGQYDKVVVSNANDNPVIFLASYYPIPPQTWQNGLAKENVSGFGILDKFENIYIGQVDGQVGVDNLSQYLDSKTLYFASAREFEKNLTMNPEIIPTGLRLVDTIFYPSGEPAFYGLTVF